MAKSVFREEFDRQGPVVTFLLLEFLEEGMAALGASVDLARQIDVVYEAMEKASCATDDRSVALAVLGRLQRPPDAASQEPKEEGPPRNGVVLSEYLGSLSPADMCMLLADYDPTEARRLFCVEDFGIVVAAAQAKMRRAMTDYYSTQEAVAIAFGGLPDEEGSEGGDEKPARRPAQDKRAVQVATANCDDMNARLSAIFAHKIKPTG